jgi:hypothetical protein
MQPDYSPYSIRGTKCLFVAPVEVTFKFLTSICNLFFTEFFGGSMGSEFHILT